MTAREPKIGDLKEAGSIPVILAQFAAELRSTYGSRWQRKRGFLGNDSSGSGGQGSCQVSAEAAKLNSIKNKNSGFVDHFAGFADRRYAHPGTRRFRLRESSPHPQWFGDLGTAVAVTGKFAP